MEKFIGSYNYQTTTQMYLFPSSAIKFPLNPILASPTSPETSSVFANHTGIMTKKGLEGQNLEETMDTDIQRFFEYSMSR
jgi:hypothetical protein